MVKHLPEWIMSRYSKLWLRFKTAPFTKKEAISILPKDSSIAVLLSELRKSGWLQIEMDKKDARKTIYSLIDPEKAILSLIKEMGKK